MPRVKKRPQDAAHDFPAPAPVAGVALKPCALDAAPINSKVVVVRVDARKFPLLATPAGLVPLEADDVAHTLPDGAKVTRLGPTRFIASELGVLDGRPMLETPTAREAIARYIDHFHGRVS